MHACRAARLADFEDRDEMSHRCKGVAQVIRANFGPNAIGKWVLYESDPADCPIAGFSAGEQLGTLMIRIRVILR